MTRTRRATADPYGHPHQVRRKALIRPGAVCHLCGDPATELDHVPALALHDHVEGTSCCRSLPACGPCQRKQAIELGWSVIRARQGTGTRAPFIDEGYQWDDSPGAEDAMWDRAPWLEPWRSVPTQGRWPRFMTGPHADAVGSYGPEAVAWLSSEAGLELRWWQELALVRQLEHDGNGVLVWLDVLASTSRQSGKSTWIRCGSTWRLHQGARFAEPQTILHTGKDLPVCKEVQRPAMTWALERGYPVRQQNGNEQITDPATGGRWIIRGKGSVYGYPSSMVLVDEAWGVPPEVVEDGLEPTMAERFSPQMVLASTAHRRATVLYPTRRIAALDELNTPGTTLILEWSTPRDVDIADRDVWRSASPHWSNGRARLLEARLRRVEAGQSLDPDEDDPHESFLAQYLNVWPVRAGPRSGERLLPEGVWESAQTELATTGPVWVAVEDNYGNGAAVAAAAELPDDCYEIDGWTCASWDDALASARLLVESRPGSKLIVGPAVAQRVKDLRPRPTRAGQAETKHGLALFRELAHDARLVHDRTPDLDDQVLGARVRPVPGGGLTFISARRSDVLRAAVWALAAAQQRVSRPAIH